MSVTATRKTTIVYSGDTVGTQVVEAASNAASPGSVEITDLSSGFNSITVPDGGTTPVAITIKPPTGNTDSIIVKGVTGDTGVRIHNTDPTTLALDSSVTAIGLTAGAAIAGVRLYWT